MYQNIPMNTVVIEKTPMRMSCGTNLNQTPVFYWKFGEKEETVFNGENISGNYKRFDISSTSRQCHLSVPSTRMTDAGIYKCEVRLVGNGKLENYAHLIVLASDPACSKVQHSWVEGDTIQMQCSLTFGGSWTPTMQWKRVFGFEDAEDARENVSCDFVLSTLTMRATADRNGARFICSTFFRQTNHSVNLNYATNIPDYNHIWKSPILNIFHKPYNLTLLPMQDVYHPGDVLVCSAKSNPDPEFEWSNESSGLVTIGPELFINVSMISSKAHKYRCTAWNSVRERNLTWSINVDLLFFVKPIEFDNGRNYNVSIIVTSVVVADALLVIMVFVIVYIRTTKNSQYAKNDKNLSAPHEYDEIEITNEPDEPTELQTVHTYVNDPKTKEKNQETVPDSETRESDETYTGLTER